MPFTIDFTAPVATVADHHLECEQTRMGPRVVGKNFETLVYPVADIRRTRALMELAEQYCSKSDFSMKSLEPIA
jgi:hypothetical protein